MNRIHEGVCYGDLGSPLISEDGILVGLVSMHNKTCANGSPDIYTNVYTLLQWIDYTINGI